MFFKKINWDFFGTKAKQRSEELEKQVEELSKERQKVYKNLMYSNGIITVVFHEGEVMSATKPVEIVDMIKNAWSEDGIRKLMAPTPVIETKSNEDEEEQDKINNFNLYKDEVLSLLGDKFSSKDENFFFENINLPLPSIVLNSFIELKKANDEEGFIAMEMFWYWAALNPIESSRNDLLNFVKKNDIKITTNGLLEMYRRVVKVTEDNTLAEFISNAYYKIKKAKKNPNKRAILQDVDNPNNLIVCKIDEFGAITNIPEGQGTYQTLGRVKELYLGLPNMESEAVYTDNHTKKKVIKIGEIYREDENKIDLDNTRDCSSGLHVGSHTFSFNGFGDTGVMALVNPMFVRSVPISEANKMRVSEMFIVGAVELDDYKSNTLLEGQLSDFSDLYSNQTIEELQTMLKDKSFDKIVCQDNITPVNLLTIKEITDSLRSKIVLV